MALRGRWVGDAPRATALLCTIGCLAPALVVSGCADTFATCPAAGGPAWREVASDHFTLRTDLGSDEARATLRDLDTLLVALLAVFRLPRDFDTGRIPVVVLRHGWGEIGGQAGGVFLEALFHPLIIMPATSNVARQDIIKHELVHYFGRLTSERRPLWLEEGLATYFETVAYDVDTHEVAAGRPPDSRLRAVLRGGLLDTTEMRATKGIAEDRAGAFYATAWLMVHYLMNRHPDELRSYEEAVTKMPESAAWARSFPDLAGDKLDWELRSYLDGGAYTVLVFHFDLPGPASPPERPMTDADVHATRALVLATGSRIGSLGRPEIATEQRDGARREAAEALRQEPPHVLAQSVLHFALGAPVDLAAARLMTTTHPDDWMAWLLLAHALRANRVTENQVAAFESAARLMKADRAATITISVQRPAPQ